MFGFATYIIKRLSKSSKLQFKNRCFQGTFNDKVKFIFLITRRIRFYLNLPQDYVEA